MQVNPRILFEKRRVGNNDTLEAFSLASVAGMAGD
jgi:hypothetical protein